MKQIEIDSEVHQWFSARDRQIKAQWELEQATNQLATTTEKLAKRLLPSDAKSSEIYIFPSTNGKAVRVGLRGFGDPYALRPFIEEHDFNRASEGQT